MKNGIFLLSHPCDSEGYEDGKEIGEKTVGKYLAIQNWSSNMVKVILNIIEVLNGGLSAILRVSSTLERAENI